MYSFGLRNYPLPDGKKTLEVRFRSKDKGFKLATPIQLNDRDVISVKRNLFLDSKVDEKTRMEFEKLKTKAEVLWRAYIDGAISFEEIKIRWQTNGGYSTTFEGFIRNELKGRKRESTLTARLNAVKSFKKHYGRTKGDLIIQDVSPRSCEVVRDRMRMANLSQESINSCLKGIRATYNEMVRAGIRGADEELKLPKKLIVRKRPNFTTLIKFEDFESAINNCNTRLDWCAVGIGLLSYSLRGLDMVDIFKINDKMLYEKVNKSAIYHSGSFPNEAPVHIILGRSKINDPIKILIQINRTDTFLLFQYLRENFKYCLNTVAPNNTNDKLALTDLAFSWDYKDYRSLSMTLTKKFHSLSGHTFKTIRKTFRTQASIIANVSQEEGNLLLGQVNENISAHYLISDALIPRLDEIHSSVLDAMNIALAVKNWVTFGQKRNWTELDSKSNSIGLLA